jgi:hypothetical protein
VINEPEKPDRGWTGELTVTGQKLVGRIKTLVAEGNGRRLIIRKPDGETLLGIPLTAGVVAGGDGKQAGAAHRMQGLPALIRSAVH